MTYRIHIFSEREECVYIYNYDDVETTIKIDMDFPERDENVMFSIYERF